MADRVMRAVALIEARAQGIENFAKIAKGAENVAKTMKLVEKASTGLGKAMLKGADVSNLTKARDALAKSRENVTKLKSEFEAAQSKAKALAQALKAGGDAAAYDKAVASVKRLSTALDRAGAAHERAKTRARGAMAEFTAAKGAVAATSGGGAGGGGVTLAKAAGVGGAVGAVARGGGRPSAPSGVKAHRFTPMSLSPGGIAVGAALYGAKRAHDEVADAHHDFQLATLKQQAVLDYDENKQRPLSRQAVKIGQETKFTNADIVRAQTDIGGKLAKEFQTPETIAAITEATKNYALAMEVSMQEGGEAVVGWMKSRGYDLSTPQAAAKSATRASNQMVQFAKTSGAKHHDIIGDTKFGAAPGRVAGYSEEFSNAMSAQLIRIGYEGAMAGNFVRGSAMRLSAPSNKGMAAIAAAGLNYNDYVKPGADPSADGLGRMVKQKFGRGLSPEALARVKEALNDDETKSSPENFVATLSEILNDTFAKKNKKGEVRAQDAERIAKTVQEFFNMSTQGVDTERLMKDLVRRGLTPALAKYLFGQEHGGRAQALNADQLEKDQQTYKNTPEDRAKKIADKMQEGAQGEYNQMLGSIETFEVALGEATDGVRSFTYKGIGALFDFMTAKVKGEDPDVKQRRVEDEASRRQSDLRRAIGVRQKEGHKVGPTEAQLQSELEHYDEVSRRTHQRRSESVRGEPSAGGGQIEATVKPDQITAKAEVTGEATVKVPVTVTVNDGAVKGLIRAEVSEQMGKMRVHTNGAGSTGRSSPDAD